MSSIGEFAGGIVGSVKSAIGLGDRDQHTRAGDDGARGKGGKEPGTGSGPARKPGGSKGPGDGPGRKPDMSRLPGANRQATSFSSTPAAAGGGSGAATPDIEAAALQGAPAPTTPGLPGAPGGPTTPTATSATDAALAGVLGPTGGNAAITAGGPVAGGDAVVVYDGSQTATDGSSQLIGSGSEVAQAGPVNARSAAANVQKGLDYFSRTFGRAGVDGSGKPIDVIVNERSKDENGNEIFRGNASYFLLGEGPAAQESLRFGKAKPGMNEMTQADDITIHELSHGVIRHETGIVGGTEDETGAVVEAVADVFAASATRDWRIGEASYKPGGKTSALRDISRPNDPGSLHGLWGSMREYRSYKAKNGSIEEHFASGIVSRTAHRLQQKLGWEPMEQLFYGALTSGGMGRMTFAETARALRAQSGTMWGDGSQAAKTVDAELKRAGL